MKYLHYSSDGRRFSCDSELVFTHVVMGQWDEVEDKKKIPDTTGKTNLDFSPEELTVIAKFVYKSTHGWYAMKPLAWATSLEEANAFVEQFRTDRINISVEEVKPEDIILYA